MVTGAQGGRTVEQLAAQFGLQPEQARSAMGALMPAVAAGLQKNMSSESGLTRLLDALGQGGHEAYLQQPEKLREPATVADGNAILGHIFGSKEVSREVAARASQKSGVDPSILKKMLPLVAALAMGGMAKQTRASGGGPAAAGGLASMLGPVLDRDRDGSMVDDVVGMIGGFLGKRRPS